MKLDTTSPEALRARAALMRAGFGVWIRGRFFALAPSPAEMHGWHVVASATSLPALARKVGVLDPPNRGPQRG